MRRRARLNVREYSFGHRVTDSWNGLLSSVNNAKSINNFKDKFEKYWITKHYCTCPHACAGGNVVIPTKTNEERVSQAQSFNRKMRYPGS